MPISVDELQIELNAKATSANDAIDKLIGKLDRLSTSLNKLNGSGINGVANGLGKLGRSMQTINSIDSRAFTRLAGNIQKLGAINVYNLNSSASALSNITRAFNQLGGVSQSAQQVKGLADSISSLGKKSVVNATQNIPLLANSLSHLMKVLSKAPVVSNNVIGLVNSLSNLTSQGAKVGSSSNSIVRSLNNIGNTSEKTSKKVFSLASAFGSLYANFFWVIRGFKSVWSSIGETTDYIESFNYYTVAFDKIASEWDDKYESYGTENAKKYTNAFVTEMSDNFSKLSGLKLNLDKDLENGILSDTGMKNLGLNLKEVTQYASQLASVTNSVGQTGQVSLMTADAFTKLAGDMSSLFNVDFSTVAKNLQSGLIGQSRALYKYGIDITNATLQTYAYKLGLEKAVSEMTQMEKMQLRMIAILDQSKVSWGDLADTINTPANMLRQLSNNFKEASMVLGQLFLPLLNKVLPVINGVVIAIKNLLSSMASFVGIDISLDNFGSGVTESTDDLYDMQEGLDEATDSAKKLKNQLQGFDKLNNITTSNASNVNGAIGGTVDLSSQIQKATEEYQKAWEEAYANMENKAQDFAKNVEKALKPVRDMFEHFAIGDFFAVGQDVTKIVVGIQNFLSEALKSVNWEKFGEDFGNFLKGINWGEIIKNSFKLTFDLGKAIADVWLESFNVSPLETGIISLLAVGFTVDKFTEIGGKIGSSIIEAVGKKIADNTDFADAIAAAGSMSLSKAGLLTFAVPVLISAAALTFEWKVGKEQEELNKLIEEQGEEAGRKAAGSGFFDMQALYRRDVETTNQAITSSYFQLGDKIKGFFADWNTKVIEHQTVTQNANNAVTVAYQRMFSDIGKNISTWWNNDVRPWFTKEKWQSLANGIKTGIQNKWSEVVSWWNSKPALKQISVKAADILQSMKDAWKKVTDWWEKAKNSLSNIKLGISVPTIKVKYDAKGTGADLWKVFGFDGTPKLSVEFKQYANGGFPEDGWFRASKGEYFGSFDDGTSVIANNNQIISGISNGVKSANAEQNALLREQNALLRQILAKDVGISTRDVFNAVRSENREYINRNGESAFAY